MSQYTVLFDANVLYPAPMQLAVSDPFKAKWTADLHREWIDALLRNELHRDRAALEQTRDFMGGATRDCLVPATRPWCRPSHYRTQMIGTFWQAANASGDRLRFRAGPDAIALLDERKAKSDADFVGGLKGLMDS